MTLFSYYTCVFLEVRKKTDILIRRSGVWTQTRPRDLGKKKQRKESRSPCLTHDQCTRQSNNNEPLQCETFEIAGKVKYVEIQNSTRPSLSRISSKKD